MNSIEHGSVAVQYSRSRGLVRLVVGFDPATITAELPLAKAREIAQALIDAAARAEGNVPYCRCAAGERSVYETCRECNDGDLYEDGGQ
jgi:hypothetical protein